MYKVETYLDPDRKVFRVLIKHVEEKKGSSNVVFTDGEAEMAANIWVSAAEFPYEGKVVDLTLTMKNGYINIKGAVIAPDGDPAEYVRHVPIDPDQSMNMISVNGLLPSLSIIII